MNINAAKQKEFGQATIGRKFGPLHKLGAVTLAAGMAISFSGCGRGAKAEAQPDMAKLATKEEVKCAFDGAADLANTPTCYEITVPEDWSKPDAADSVVVPVAVFHATDPNAAADPLIYLDGGPGAETLSLLRFTEDGLVSPHVASRDVIVFDQRGIGESTPSLVCPEVTDATLANMQTNPPLDEAAASVLKAVKGCHDRLTADGVNLTAFNSIASAYDIEAIRTTLGYKQLNVWGTSYGTRLAQTYMRMYPKSARTVTIDSVMPEDVNVDESISVTGERSLKMVFAACAADAACSSAHPTLEKDYFALLDQLDAKPISVEAYTMTGETITVIVNGDSLVGLTFQALYDPSLFTGIPQMVSDVQAGNYAWIESVVGLTVVISSFISDGSYLSVECNEEVPFESAKKMDENVSTDPNYSRLSILNGPPTQFEKCAQWPAGKAPAVENEPVESSLPTLVMTGSFDPITPPSYAKRVADHLSKSYFVEFPTEGHGVSTNECGAQILEAFLADPSKTPDSSCVAEMPAVQWVS